MSPHVHSRRSTWRRKSSLFGLSCFADHAFRADDRAAELNGGSYEHIPISVRAVVNREFENFIHANIHAGTSFALETTLRGTITFQQAMLAKKSGFRVFMLYGALNTRAAPLGAVIQQARALFGRSMRAV